MDPLQLAPDEMPETHCGSFRRLSGDCCDQSGDCDFRRYKTGRKSTWEPVLALLSAPRIRQGVASTVIGLTMAISPERKKMTTQPPTSDAPPPPDERQFSELVESTPKQPSTALKASLAVLVVSIVVILAAGFIAWRHFNRSSTPIAQPAPSSRPAAQPPPTAQPAQPLPASQLPSAPTQAYVKTPWGTRCQVGESQIVCDTCEPGLVLDTPAGAVCPGPSLNELMVDASGASLTPPTGVILTESSTTQQLSDGQTYHLKGWTIAVSRWVRFTNDATGHGMAVAAQNMEFF
jgi:hypothetical protein